jgi:hypothetical protein
MKIIDIGVCVNNVDPKGIGRIRYRPYGLLVGDVEKSMEYEEWDENDQLIAIPFLPAHINIIPQIHQSIKLIKYDTDKDTQNVEYISGPYSSSHDFESESFISQHKYTTYGGVIVQDRPDVRDDKSGNYIDKKSDGAIANLNDFGIYGNYGSDIIFTQNGINIRGGKFVTKNITNKVIKKRLEEVPYLSEKMAKLNLKKFSYAMTSVNTTTTDTVISNLKIKYVIEYDLDKLDKPDKIHLMKRLN